MKMKISKTPVPSGCLCCLTLKPATVFLEISESEILKTSDGTGLVPVDHEILTSDEKIPEAHIPKLEESLKIMEIHIEDSCLRAYQSLFQVFQLIESWRGTPLSLAEKGAEVCARKSGGTHPENHLRVIETMKKIIQLCEKATDAEKELHEKFLKRN